MGVEFANTATKEQKPCKEIFFIKKNRKKRVKTLNQKKKTVKESLMARQIKLNTLIRLENFLFINCLSFVL